MFIFFFSIELQEVDKTAQTEEKLSVKQGGGDGAVRYKLSTTEGKKACKERICYQRERKRRRARATGDRQRVKLRSIQTCCSVYFRLCTETKFRIVMETQQLC